MSRERGGYDGYESGWKRQERERHKVRNRIRNAALGVLTAAVITVGAKLGLDAIGIDPIKAFVRPEPIARTDPNLRPWTPSERNLGPGPIPEAKPKIETIYASGNIITLKNGIPYECVLENGERVSLDYERMRSLRLTAIEPEVATSIPMAGEKQGVNFQPTPDRPRYLGPQEDTLTTEQLREMGIEIVNPTGENTPQLSIRAGAFKKGELLSEYKAGGDEKLIIVVVSGPFPLPGYMTEPQYRRFLSLVEKTEGSLASYRAEQIKFWETALEKARAKASAGENQESMVVIKLELYRYQTLSDEELFADWQRASSSNTAGWFCSPGYVESKTGMKKTAVVFATARGSPPSKSMDIVYRPDLGGWQFFETTHFAGGDRTPTPGKNIPRPGDFFLDSSASADNPRSYPYGAQHCPGQVTRHELAHNLLRLVGKVGDYFSEFVTDTLGMDSIARAWQRFKDSNFKDNFLYYFQWKIPQKYGGGYIVTERDRQPREAVTGLEQARAGQIKNFWG